MMAIRSLSCLLVGCAVLLPQSVTQTAQPAKAKAIGEANPGNLPATGQGVIVLGGIEARTNAVTFSPDGKLIACGGEDRRVRIFNESGRLITRIGVSAPTYSIAFSPDGKRIALAGAMKLVTDGPVITLPEYSPPIPADYVEPKGRLPISGSQLGRIWPRGRSVHFHDVQTGAWLGGGGGDHVPAIVSIAYSGDGSSLAMFDSEISLRIQKTPWGMNSTTRRPEGAVSNYAESLGILASLGGDAFRIVSVGQSMRLLDLIASKNAGGSRLRELDLKDQRTLCAMRLDGKRFLIGSQDGSLSEWDFEKGSLIRTFDKGSTGTRLVEFLAYSPDGQRIVSGDEAGVVRLYEADSGRLLQTRNGPGKPVRAATFLASGLRIACGGYHLRNDPTLPQAEFGTAEPILVWEMERE